MIHANRFARIGLRIARATKSEIFFSRFGPSGNTPFRRARPPLRVHSRGSIRMSSSPKVRDLDGCFSSEQPSHDHGDCVVRVLSGWVLRLLLKILGKNRKALKGARNPLKNKQQGNPKKPGKEAHGFVFLLQYHRGQNYYKKTLYKENVLAQLNL